MRGEIAITDEVVKYNAMEASVFDLFKIEMRRFTKSKKAGWYAYKHENGIYYFKWIDWEHEEQITDKYLTALKNDGWTTGITRNVIEDAFN